MSQGEDAAAAERGRMLQAMMLADLGTARRNECTTVDNKRAHFQASALESQRWIHVEGSEAQRQFKIDEEQLNKWNTLHETLGDTTHMEALPDIAAGQSHRASLNAAMRALENQSVGHQVPGFFGRGGGRGVRGSDIAGSRGRGFLPPRNNTTTMVAISKPGRPGPVQRSATASYGLDPALNINNDPSQNDSRPPRGPRGPRGPRRQMSVQGLPSSLQLQQLPPPQRLHNQKQQQKQQPKQQQPQRPSRQQTHPAVNFSSMMADPANFMTSYRRTSEMPPASQETKASQGPAIPGSPSVKPGKNTPKSEAPAAPAVVPKPPIQPGRARAQSVISESSVLGMMGSYRVETPTPAPKVTGASKVLTLRSTKSNTSAVRPNAVPPADVEPASKEIQWSLSPGEYPRTSRPIVPVAQKLTAKIAGEGKQSVARTPKQTKTPGDSLAAPVKSSASKKVTSNVSAAAVGQAKKAEAVDLTPQQSKAPSGSLLDTANSPISTNILQTTPAHPLVMAKENIIDLTDNEQKDDKPVAPSTPKLQTGKKDDKPVTPSTPKLQTGKKDDKPVTPSTPKLQTGKKDDKLVVPSTPKLQTGKKDDKLVVPSTPKLRTKKKAKPAEPKETQPASLLDTDNQPISEDALEIPVHTMTPAVQTVAVESPGASDLLGLEIQAEDSPKSIDGVIALTSQLAISREEFDRILDERVNKEVETRVEHALKLLKCPSRNIARYSDWLDQADAAEATVVREALRKDSFTRHRSPPRNDMLSDSSPEPSPIPKEKTSSSPEVVTEGFAIRFTNTKRSADSAFSVDDTSAKVSSALAVAFGHDVPLGNNPSTQDTPTQASSTLAEVASRHPGLPPIPAKKAPETASGLPMVSPVPVRAAPISAKGASSSAAIPAHKPAPKPKQQGLLDSVYASMPELPVPRPRILSGNIRKPKDPRAAGVQVVGPAPYDPKKKAKHGALGPQPGPSENTLFAGSAEAEAANRVKVIGVQPYNPANRQK